MGLTPKQRDQHPMCGAKKKNGDTCRAYAGQGTDHFGIGACKFHSGATPAAKKHAVKIEAKRRMVTMGVPLDGIHPAQALLGILRATAGHVKWLHEEVADLDDLASPESVAILNLYDQERDRLTRIGEACVRAGASEGEVEIQQGKAELMVQAIRAAAKDAGLTPKQHKAIGISLRKQLAQLSDDEDSRAAAAGADRELKKIVKEIRDDEERRIEQAAAARPPADLAYPPAEWLAPDEETASRR